MSSPAPTLSVVIACRNEAELLPLQLAALRDQQRDGWVDTVVVDDGSTDGTHRTAEQHGEGLPGFRVVRIPPRGRPAALNAGISATQGDCVVFVDGDDEVAPGYLAAMRAALVDHPFVAGRIDHTTLNPDWLTGTRPPEQSTGLCHEPQQPWPVAGGGTLAVRREVLEAVGGFDDEVTYVQDSDLCWRIAMAGVRLTFVPDAVLRYRYRRTARQTFTQARRYGRGGVLLEYRYGSRPSILRIARRSLRLVLLARHLPWFARPEVRVATGFRAGHLVGWLEAAGAPRRLFPDAALRRIVASDTQGSPHPT